MKARNSQKWIAKLGAVVGVVGASVLMYLPTTAQTRPAGNPSGSMDTPAEMQAPGTQEPGMQAPGTTRTTVEGQTIVALASSNDQFKTLKAALEAAGLTEILEGQGPFTVFAPTNAAFEALGKEKLQALLKPENKDKLVKVLTYHVVAGELTSSDLKSGETKTAEGGEVKIKVNSGSVMVNNAKVTKADIKASNGIIHAIDKVLLPPDLKL